MEEKFGLTSTIDFERIVIYEYQKASNQRKAEIIRQQMKEIDKFYLNYKNIIKCKEDAVHCLLLMTIVDARLKIIDLLLNK
jgi:hypothetical protein